MAVGRGGWGGHRPGQYYYMHAQSEADCWAVESGLVHAFAAVCVAAAAAVPLSRAVLLQFYQQSQCQSISLPFVAVHRV